MVSRNVMSAGVDEDLQRLGWNRRVSGGGLWLEPRPGTPGGAQSRVAVGWKVTKGKEVVLGGAGTVVVTADGQAGGSCQLQVPLKAAPGA